MFELEILSQLSSNTYGLIIIAISIITRIFVVSIAWSYGAFLVALKKSFPDSYFTELGWIAGVAQGLGSVISPLYILLANKLGIRSTFFAALVLCFLSLLSSSYVKSEHSLFFTYSIPFGIGSSIVFVLGSILTGTYFPPDHKHHVTTTVAIGLGFPLGFLILNPLTDALMRNYEYDWQIVQRIYCAITFLLILICCPFFTEKFAEKHAIEESVNSENKFRTDIYFLKSYQVGNLVKYFWLAGLFFISCANNSVLINLNGYFSSVGVNSTNSLNSKYLALGSADTFYRIILAAFGRMLGENLSYFYILSSIIGMFISLLWTVQKQEFLNTLFCIFYAICPAVMMSLMYSINSEIIGRSNIQKGYTLNVMISGFGIITGPIISGYMLDSTKKNYDSVLRMASVLFAFSLIFFLMMKALLVKNERNNKDADVPRTDYTEFENEN